MATALTAAPAGSAFSATARVDYYSDGTARKGKLFVLATLPDHLRIEALTFTDDMLSLLVVNQTQFAYFERGKPECFSGPLCAAPIVARFPMASNPKMLLPMLLGRVSLLDQAESQTVAFDRETGLYVYTRTQGELVQEIKVDPDKLFPQELRLLRDGLLELQVTYSGRMETEQGPVPKSCRLVAPAEKLDLSIEYRQFDWETTVEPQAFEFQCPEGATLYPLDCRGIR